MYNWPDINSILVCPRTYIIPTLEQYQLFDSYPHREYRRISLGMKNNLNCWTSKRSKHNTRTIYYYARNMPY